MTAPTTPPTSTVQKLERAHYLIMLEATTARLLLDNPGDRTLQGVLAAQEPRLRELADLLAAVRREVGAWPSP